MTNTSSRKTYTRGTWGTAVWFDDNFCRIRLKNPQGSLMVNTIVYRDDEVLLVIDPGWPWTLDALEEAMQALEIVHHSLADEVTHFLYTHTHIDHMGAAALLSHRSDASHHFLEELLAYTPAWHTFQNKLAFWDDWMVEITAGAHREQITQWLKERGPRTTITDTYGELDVLHGQTFAIGDRIKFGSLELDVHDASGHDPYHVAFLEPRRELLISGDAALAIPTPITGVMGDDLGLYEATLDRLEALGAKAMIPGHGTQVLGKDQVRAHIQKSRSYVTHYKDSVRRVLGTRREPVGMWAIALELAPDQRMVGQTMRWWAHLGLVQARLERMVQMNEAQCIQGEDGPRYILVE